MSSVIRFKMIPYDTNRCNASKNQKEGKFIQCSHKKKGESQFCGKHQSKLSTYLEIYQSNNIKHGELEKNNLINEENNKKENECYCEKDIDKNVNENLVLDTISNNAIVIKGKIIYKKVNKNLKNKLKLSLKNDDIYKKMIQNRNIFLDNNKNDKFVSILDYFFDDSLGDFSKFKINNTFKKNKLMYTKNELIDLVKLNSKKDSENKELFKVRKQEYTKNRVKSFFEFVFIGRMNEDKIRLIQKNFRIFIKRKNIKQRGLATYNRSICVNNCDFYTFDPLEEIETYNFYSYVDNNKFVYGFHIESISELFKRKKGKVKNPYNRDYFTENVRKDVIELQKLNKKKESIEKQKINIELLVRNKCMDVFYKLDMFGYQTNINWLYDASIVTLRYFYRKLVSYWNYRFGLTSEMKQILLPNGDIINQNISIIRNRTSNKYKLLDKILDILDTLVSSAPTNEEKNIGCILILYSLAEISTECINSNPWLN